MTYWYKAAQTILLLFLTVVLPLLFRPQLLRSWPAGVFLLAGLILNFTQPHVAASQFKTKDAPDRQTVFILLIAGCLAFLLPMIDYAFMRQARPSIDSAWSLVGLAGVGGGLLFRFWSIRTLGKYFTSLVSVQDCQRVITSGPYRYLRHPSYTGTLVMAVSLSLVVRSYLGLIYCLTGFVAAYAYRIYVEEKLLTQAFGQEYENYRKGTWRLLPWVY